MKTVMILMMAILVQANTKAADTNVVGLMMASKLSPANHPALAGTAGTTATVATAAINEASKIKRQSETINFIQPEVEPEKKPESLEKPKLNLGRALVNLAFSVWDLFKAIFLVPIQRILSAYVGGLDIVHVQVPTQGPIPYFVNRVVNVIASAVRTSDLKAIFSVNYDIPLLSTVFSAVSTYDIY